MSAGLESGRWVAPPMKFPNQVHRCTEGKNKTPFVQHPPACPTEAPFQGAGRAVRIH